MNSEEIKSSIIDYIREEVKKLKYKGDSITLCNVYPSIIESALGETDDGYELNGRDCDYWADIDNYSISGCMKYGTADIELKVGAIRPEEDTSEDNTPKQELRDEFDNVIENKDDVYTRTSFLMCNRECKDIPPAIMGKTKEELDGVIAADELKPFYILFVNHCSGNGYAVIYAKEEHDARMRAFSIWGRRWDDIRDQQGWDETIEFYKPYGEGYFERKHKKLCNDIVLDYKGV